MKTPKNTPMLSEPTPKLRTTLKHCREAIDFFSQCATECETELKRRRKAGPQLGMSARKRTQQKKGAS
jgi:hypothetical protein